jgi:hypothetical protein
LGDAVAVETVLDTNTEPGFSDSPTATFTVDSLTLTTGV